MHRAASAHRVGAKATAATVVLPPSMEVDQFGRVSIAPGLSDSRLRERWAQRLLSGGPTVTVRRRACAHTDATRMQPYGERLDGTRRDEEAKQPVLRPHFLHPPGFAETAWDGSYGVDPPGPDSPTGTPNAPALVSPQLASTATTHMKRWVSLPTAFVASSRRSVMSCPTSSLTPSVTSTATCAARLSCTRTC